jgi:hypothetical protein
MVSSTNLGVILKPIYTQNIQISKWEKYGADFGLYTGFNAKFMANFD